MKSIEGAVVTITGGTGSFGSTMARNLLADGVNEIRIFSRDESKQDLMRNSFKDERVKFFLGDVRDVHSVESAVRGSNFVFHAAALKQVPSCEFFPMQAAATNISGSANVLEASYKAGVQTIVCLSTDKAVYPINAMGMTKAVMEKVAQSYARNFPRSETKVAITRYGNVMMSRGSVIPLFINQIRSGRPITLTDPTMTRFLMSLQESVELVKFAFTNAESGDLFVRKAPGCSVATLIEGLSILENDSKPIQVDIIGTRHGEKKAESLLSAEERSFAVDYPKYFRIPLDTRSLDYQIYFDKGEASKSENESYTSSNTTQISPNEVASLIASLPEYKEMKTEKKY
jgi:UDP-glucose 4-epimerase